MLCFLGMLPLFILLGNPILLLMHYPATQLLPLWICLLLLGTLLLFLVISVLEHNTLLLWRVRSA